MNHWINVVPRTANNSVLGKDEFRDMIMLRYQITPKDLPTVCDGCGKKHSLHHALQCIKGGLIGGRYDDYRDDLGLVAGQAYSPSSIRDDPRVKKGRETEDRSKKLDPQDAQVTTITNKDKQKDDGLYGDLLIRHLWQSNTDTIIDVRITDTDAKSYISRPLESVLEGQEKEKKRKYLNACLEQRRHFSPFVVSVDGMLGHEASMVLKRISQKLAQKWDCPMSYASNYVKTTMSLSLVRATHCCLRGSRVPSSAMSKKHWPCEDGAGIGLLQTAEF